MTDDERRVLTDVLLSELGTAEKYNKLVFELQAEIARLRLTDAEREAVEGAILFMETRGAWAWPATLRGLLERMQ